MLVLAFVPNRSAQAPNAFCLTMACLVALRLARIELKDSPSMEFAYINEKCMKN